MIEQRDKKWRALCKSAIAATDPEQLSQIIQELNLELKRRSSTLNFVQATDSQVKNGQNEGSGRWQRGKP